MGKYSMPLNSVRVLAFLSFARTAILPDLSIRKKLTSPPFPPISTIVADDPLLSCFRSPNAAAVPAAPDASMPPAQPQPHSHSRTAAQPHSRTAAQQPIARVRM